MPVGVYTRTKEHLINMSIAQKGHKLSLETRQRLSLARKGDKNAFFGKKHTLEARQRISLTNLGKKHTLETRLKMSLVKKGENHPRWFTDRSKLKKKQERNDVAYQDWRKQVWLRDNWKCKIANPDCKGRIEAHHILKWSEYPELRYQINNGITLCQAHHPRKRAEEKRLIPTFQELVSVSKVLN